MKNHSDRWSAYYEQNRSKPPHAHLRQALEHLSPDLPKTAIDMGCGTGRDAVYLVDQGFRVLAFDPEPEAIDELERHIKDHPTLEPVQAHFHTFDYEPVSLINASASLFFCEAMHFDEVWNQVRQAIHPGGLFCGHFLGPDDSWTELDVFSGITFGAQDLKARFDSFEILYLHERNEPGVTAVGDSKHWHVWTVIAKKH